jgi:hypothetical protein
VEVKRKVEELLEMAWLLVSTAYGNQDADWREGAKAYRYRYARLIRDGHVEVRWTTEEQRKEAFGECIEDLHAIIGALEGVDDELTGREAEHA